MLKNLFLAIAARLQEAVSDIQFIDLWNANIEYISGSAVWPTPAVFVEFDPIEWHQQGRLGRMADVGVRLHIVTREVKHNGVTDDRINTDLLRLDLASDINVAMQTLHGEGFTTPMLTNTTTNHNHTELVEDVQRYVTRLQDNAATPTLVGAGAAVQLEIRNSSGQTD